MKKTRLFAFLLTFSLLLTFLLPTYALADEGDDYAVKAKCALLVDADYGEILFEQNAYEKAYPASITKVMTALLTLEAVNSKQLGLDDMVTVPEEAMEGLSIYGSTQGIETGEEISVRNLLYCLLVASANEAANILAIQVSGSVSAFVDRMNERAQELGCTGTHFANPHGLHDDDHYTTAYDIYLIANQAMKDPLFQEIVSTKEYYVPATNLNGQRHFFNTNALLSQLKYWGYVYEYATGIKTGHTEEAGRCLVSSATKDGRTLIAVVLGASSVVLADGRTQLQDFTESAALLEYGFSNFTRKTILDTATLIREVPVTLSKEADSVIVHPAENLERYLPNDMDPASFTQTVTLHAESVEAPVTAGQVMGSITITYEGQDYGTVDLVALNDVALSQSLYRQKQLHDFFAKPWVKVLAVAILLLVVLLILRLTVFRRRSRYGRSGSSRSHGYHGRRRR